MFQLFPECQFKGGYQVFLVHLALVEHGMTTMASPHAVAVISLDALALAVFHLVAVRGHRGAAFLPHALGVDFQQAWLALRQLQ
jgi:hypothetical protein